MIIDCKYDLGDIVYLKTDVEQLPRMVTEICIQPKNVVIYCLNAGPSVSKHYDFEFTTEKDFALQ
jgi:hypothetical protein